MKRMLIHSIAADDFMQGLGVNSKLNADWEFLTHLRDVGRAEAATGWRPTSSTSPASPPPTSGSICEPRLSCGPGSRALGLTPRPGREGERAKSARHPGIC